MKRIYFAFCAACLVLLTGCTVGPRYQRPPVNAPDNYRYQAPTPAAAATLGDEKWWQLCFHLWFTFRYQQTKVGDGGAVITIPGSEKVFYWRVGWSRWDAGDCKYVVEKIGFGTWYGPGLHWD